MSDTPSVATDRTWRPKANPWLIAVVVALAAFMEVLDTSIANVALPYMAGSLSATADQSTWVLTSYLVSNAIVLPISGWLVRALGRQRFFLICLTIFTVSSLLCGIAPSLGTMIAFRARCRAPAEAACSRWHRRFWLIRFRRNNGASRSQSLP
jgi:MFS transporter, DHA2 family, multidrug resistance protein